MDGNRIATDVAVAWIRPRGQGNTAAARLSRWAAEAGSRSSPNSKARSVDVLWTTYALELVDHLDGNVACWTELYDGRGAAWRAWASSVQNGSLGPS
jgi:hypothetical protein